MKAYQQLNNKETKQFSSKMEEQREFKRKAIWINNAGNDLEKFKEGPKVKMYLHLFRATLKKVPNWKMTGHRIYGYGFEKIHFHS